MLCAVCQVAGGRGAGEWGALVLRSAFFRTSLCPRPSRAQNLPGYPSELPGCSQPNAMHIRNLFQPEPAWPGILVRASPASRVTFLCTVSVLEQRRLWVWRMAQRNLPQSSLHGHYHLELPLAWALSVSRVWSLCALSQPHPLGDIQTHWPLVPSLCLSLGLFLYLTSSTWHFSDELLQ